MASSSKLLLHDPLLLPLLALLLPLLDEAADEVDEEEDSPPCANAEST